jgi:hypothetical protein
MKCRFDNLPLTEVFLTSDLLPANSFLTEPQLNEPEIYYPCDLRHDRTFLQVDEYYQAREIFRTVRLFLLVFVELVAACSLLCRHGS